MTMPDLSGFPFKLADILRRIVNAINEIQVRCDCPYSSGGSSSGGWSKSGPEKADPIDLPAPIASPIPYVEMTIDTNVTLGEDVLNRMLYITASSPGLTVTMPTLEKGSFSRAINVGSNAFTFGATDVPVGRESYLVADIAGSFVEISALADPAP